ncbi:restriction endonuclease subunit S [Neobacillus sp. MM2021_6]|uniref:restriction endonuclease subunit S n=1 Tax=Bacillaceae TaxID=186817 RepID=UPI00140D7D5F|nr:MULTISPECIES: restriction endonuclease subunit S [Bacillaceae]MBO0962852.1 restriction endonuclease subunit S [Neobacillus sp. MM2021_6]NHC21468.1 restriction endonuclease subunit S [Bacillus sp. MM2020_4]
MSNTKESHVQWLGEVPKNWRTLKLKFLCDINTGSKDTQDKLPGGKYPFFVRSPHVESLDEFTHDEEAIMTAGDGVGVGKVFHYYEGKFAAHQRVYVFTKFKNTLGKYLYYYLMSNLKFEVLMGGAKSTVDSIRRPMLSEFPVVFPNFELQKKIVRFLDRKIKQVNDLIFSKQNYIELIEEQRQSIITEAVTKGLNPNVKMKDSGVEWIGKIPEHWEIKKIKHITQVKRGASPRPIDDQKYFDDDGEFAWVRIADVSKAGMYLNETLQVMSELGASLSIKQYPGDLFVSIAGTVGKPCISNIKCCIHDGFVYFPNYKYNKKFLYYIFACGQSYRGLGKMGTQLNLNTDTIGEIKIPWPSAKEQEGIISKLEKDVNKVDKLVELTNYQIEKLKEYRQALIYEAVTGKISVRDMEFD